MVAFLLLITPHGPIEAPCCCMTFLCVQSDVLVGTFLQRNMRHQYSPGTVLAGWLRYGEMGGDEAFPRQWD